LAAERSQRLAHELPVREWAMGQRRELFQNLDGLFLHEAVLVRDCRGNL
jgi:hypothetical protein